MTDPESPGDDLHGFPAQRFRDRHAGRMRGQTDPTDVPVNATAGPDAAAAAAAATTTTESLALTSFPLERPRIRARRKSDRVVAATLPYFISGGENRLVAFTATSPESLHQLGNPVLLIGPSGTGKSVLGLHLAAREAAKFASHRQPQHTHVDEPGSTDSPPQRAPLLAGDLPRLTYLPAVDFARRFADAVANDDLAVLRQEIDDAALLMIDDLHLIHDKPPAQEELASRLESRTFAGRLTFLTSRNSPAETRGIRSSLASRTLAGLAIHLQPPGHAARAVILNELGLVHGVILDAVMTELLQQRLPRNASFRQLESVIKQIGLWCRMNDSPADTSAVQNALNSLAGDAQISIAAVTAAVARRFQLRSADLKSRSRRQKVVRARSLAMTLTRRMTDLSLLQIGEHFGGRDHSTVLHAIRKTETLLDEDPTLRQIADEVTAKLGDR